MYVIITAGSLPTLRPLLQNTLSIYRSHKQRSSKGYHAYDHSRHALQNLRSKRTLGQTPVKSPGRGSDEDVLTANMGGITKTIDVTLASTIAEEGSVGKRWDDGSFPSIQDGENQRL